MKKRLTFSVATLLLTASLLAIPVSAGSKIATETPTTTSSSVVTSTPETEELTVSTSEASGKNTQTTKNNNHTTSTTKETTTTNANNYSNNIKSTITTSTTTTSTTTSLTTTTSTTTTSTTLPATTMLVTTTPDIPINSIWVSSWRTIDSSPVGPVGFFVGASILPENIDTYDLVLDIDQYEDSEYSTTLLDWFVFGHNDRVFAYLTQTQVGDSIVVNLNGELSKFVVHSSQPGKVSDDCVDIVDSEGTSLIKDLPTDDKRSIKLITCYEPLSGNDDRWVVVATATE